MSTSDKISENKFKKLAKEMGLILYKISDHYYINYRKMRFDCAK